MVTVMVMRHLAVARCGTPRHLLSCVTPNIIQKFSIIRGGEHQVSQMTSQLINCLPGGGDNDMDHVILLGIVDS